jgi:hypothetical protein
VGCSCARTSPRRHWCGGWPRQCRRFNTVDAIAAVWCHSARSSHTRSLHPSCSLWPQGWPATCRRAALSQWIPRRRFGRNEAGAQYGRKSPGMRPSPSGNAASSIVWPRARFSGR